jgi:hypothetical protein
MNLQLVQILVNNLKQDVDWIQYDLDKINSNPNLKENKLIEIDATINLISKNLDDLRKAIN